MAETIFLLNHNGELVEMTESHYLTENDFQKLLADYPKLISGEQINQDNPRRWLLVSREMSVPDELFASGRWSLDHLFIDQEGIPTLVEVKRSTDTRLRREVVGQILDYAANAVSYWSIEDIIHTFQSTCNIQGINTEEILSEFLLNEMDVESFWKTVETNLKAGKVRMLLVADVIPKELQRIIEFLNEQMSPAEILGLEVKQFIGQNLKTLVPRVVGATAKAETQKSPVKRAYNKWDEPSFIEEIRRRHPGQVEVVQNILNRSKALFEEIWWGEGNRTGSFVPALTRNGQFIQLFGLYTSGHLEIQFQWLKRNAPFDNPEKRKELLNRLNGALGTKYDNIDKRPNTPVAKLEKPGVLDAFFKVVKWYVDEVNAYYNN